MGIFLPIGGVPSGKVCYQLDRGLTILISVVRINVVSLILLN